MLCFILCTHLFHEAIRNDIIYIYIYTIYVWIMEITNIHTNYCSTLDDEKKKFDNVPHLSDSYQILPSK